MILNNCKVLKSSESLLQVQQQKLANIHREYVGWILKILRDCSLSSFASPVKSVIASRTQLVLSKGPPN